MPNGKGEFFRQCRLWHGYLSACAFIALLFFALTGLSLNHPGWLKSPPLPLQQGSDQLTAVELAQVKTAADPGAMLTRIVGGRTKLAGVYKDSDAAGPNLFVRLQGVRGASDLVADLRSGQVSVTVEGTSTVEIFDALHRGEKASAAWRLLIDIFAIVMIAVSLIGYMLFLSLRRRWRTALVLTTLSAFGSFAVFLVFVA